MMLHKPKDLYLSSFKVMNRFLVNEIVKYRGPFRHIDGLIYHDPESRADSSRASCQHPDRRATHFENSCGCG